MLNAPISESVFFGRKAERVSRTVAKTKPSFFGLNRDMFTFCTIVQGEIISQQLEKIRGLTILKKGNG